MSNPNFLSRRDISSLSRQPCSTAVIIPSYRINLCRRYSWPVFSGNVAPPTHRVPDSSRQRQMVRQWGTAVPPRIVRLAIGRSLQAVPRNHRCTVGGQTQREIRASSPLPPSFPFRDSTGCDHTPRRCCATTMNDSRKFFNSIEIPRRNSSILGEMF